MFEFMLTLFRLEERARAFFLTTILNVLATIGLTVVLVVGAGEGARGLLLGSYASGAVFVLGLIVAPAPPPLAPLRPRAAAAAAALRPADDAGRGLALPAQLRRPDHHRPLRSGSAEAGLYSLAVKFAQAVNVLVRGFQLAWPPLAYSIRDDGEARRAYATIVTLFVAGCAFVVTGMWLFSRWIVRALAAPEFFDSYKAIGLISTAVTLYALYLVLVVILGRTGRTEFNFPAAIAALVANVVLNLILVPPLGIVGAGLALVASYLVVLALMYGFTQRLFPVPYQWGRLARVVLASAVLVGVGELLMPTSGAAGLLGRAALFAAYPLVLFASGFFTPGERGWLARLRHPGELARLRSQRLRAEPSRGRRPRPRGLRGRADGRGRPALTASERHAASAVDSAAFRPLSSLRPARSRIDFAAARGRAPGGRGPSRRARAGWGGRSRRGRGAA